MHEGLKQFTEMVPKVDLGVRERMALVIIDMQYHDASPDRGLCRAWAEIAPGSMDYYNDRLRRKTVPAIRSLLDLFRAEGLSVIHLVLGSDYTDLRDCPERFRNWTRNLEAATGIRDLWWSGNPDFQILEELTPAAGETIVKKTTNGAFNGSELDRTLSRMGISTLVVTGVITSACVDATARDAADRGYDCVLVSDALADYDPQMHAATLQSFALSFGRVVETAEEVMEAIRCGTSL
ncbi:isochorismatase family cysteine hydrolase [Rhodospirillaceae bacterium SYSU D60014]|uniref:cysteine hydrolase family protein n=1 Tax=Virgifigura deserti TaxID=2268457 RepID=UPI000E66E836